MPMRATTVRFGEDLWQLLEAEAAAQGVSAAQFVRDATIMRIAYVLGQRGDPRLEEALGRGDGGSAQAVPGDGVGLGESLAVLRDAERLESLRGTELLGSPREESFDRQARLAAQVLNAPVALVSLVEEDRQFFKSCLGLPEPWCSRREAPLTHSFCQHVVARQQPLVIDDAREHPVLKDNLAIRDMGVVAYAGVPLIDSNEQALGTLCVIDTEPRQFSKDQVKLLEDLAASVVTQIELAREAARRGREDPS